jgi:4-amino-4-deoxy-L-arabinose transferase-like glycosyltransferase
LRLYDNRRACLNARLETVRPGAESPERARAGIDARAERRGTPFVLILPALVTLALSVLFWHGLQATDDLRYARMAMALLPGEHGAPMTLPPNHHGARIALVYPLAAVFAAFGPSETSLAILPAMASALTALLVGWLASRLGGRAAGLAAGLLYAVFPLTLGLSTFFVPEPLVGFETCLAAALFVRAGEVGGERAWRLLFAAGIVVGVAYLTTEIGALMLPVFYGYLIATQRRVLLRHHALLAGFAIVFLAELAYHHAVDGNALYRFSLTTGYLGDPMLVGANANLGYRLLKTIPAMFVYPGLEFGLFGPLLIAAGVYGLVRRGNHLLFVLWAAVIVLFYNFMSVSLTRYIVLPVTGRLIAPACLPLLVLCGAMAADAAHRIARIPSSAWKLAGRTALAAFASVIVAFSLFAMWLDAHGPSFTRTIAQNAKQAAVFLQRYAAVVVVTDRRSAAAVQFYRRFDPADVYLPLEDASRSSIPAQDSATPAFVLRNGPVVHEQALTGERYGRPFLRQAEQASLERLLADRRSPVFAAQLRADPSLKALLAHAPVRYLLGQRRTRIVEQLSEQPSLGTVELFELAARPHP